MAFKIPSLEEMEKVHENMDTTAVTLIVILTNARVILEQNMQKTTELCRFIPKRKRFGSRGIK